MLFSICIPSYNRGHRAAQLVKKFLALPYSEDRIEIIFSNNGSDKYKKEYQEIKKIKDKRFRYHEFESNQGFARNINQVIKMSHGEFCMLLSDEDEILMENLDNYMNFLDMHPELGLVKSCTSLAYSDLQTQYVSNRGEAVDHFYLMGNYISGTIYNRNIISDVLIEDYEKKYQKNEAYIYYVHLFLDAYALLHGNYCSSDLLLIEEGVPADHFDTGPDSPDPTVPVFGTYESRIAQMHGFLEQVRDLEAEPAIVFQMLARVMERVVEWINIQKDKYISHGDDWGKIMEMLAEHICGEILLTESMLGKEETALLYEYMEALTGISGEREEGQSMKKQIEDVIQSGDADDALAKIEEYEKMCPKDFELFSYYISYYLMTEDYETALETAKRAVQTNPFDIESNYNFAVCSELMGKVSQAYDYYKRTEYLQWSYEKEILPGEELKERAENLRQAAMEDEILMAEINKADIRYIYATSEPFRDPEYKVIGSFIVDASDDMYYVGRCDGWYESYLKHELNRDIYMAKCEMFLMDQIGTDYTVDAGNNEVLVPVAMNYIEKEDTGNTLTDMRSMGDTNYWDSACCKYNFIPVTGKSQLHCGSPALFAKPLPLHQPKDKEHKRLVLNLFMDSFNWNVVEEYGLETLMPHTYQYFSKGMICNNYYSCAEYTHPSIASYWTGRYPSHHMNLDEHYRWDFMEGIKVFPAYFKEKGYVTAKIGGNDSVTPTQGYIRGIDRFIYQKNIQGLTVKEVVSDAIEHIETFRETNQFLWLDIVDLHHVAGRFLRSLMTQAGCPLDTRVLDNNGGNTVKQNRSFNQEKIYIQELKKIDLYLSLLYHYISENYKEDEIVVSLFSDHGTAFLVDNDQPFLSDQRCKVPLLLRGSGVKKGVCDEVISAADYAGILCRLSGIEYDYKGTDAQLPVVFGGQKEREYALSQSIFLGDPYQAAFHGKDVHCYFSTDKPVQECFRIDLEGSKYCCFDKLGKDITGEMDIRKYNDVFRDQVRHLIQYK